MLDNSQRNLQESNRLIYCGTGNFFSQDLRHGIFAHLITGGRLRTYLYDKRNIPGVWGLHFKPQMLF